MAECLTLSVTDSAGPTALRLVRAAIMAPSLFALLEFGRRQVRIVGQLLPGAWIYPPLVVLALAGTLYGLEGLPATCRLALGIPGSLMSGLALWRLSETRAGQQRLGLQAGAASLWLAVPAMVLSAPNMFVPPAIENGGTEFLASAQYLSQAVLALCALGVWTGLGIYRSNLDAAEGRRSPFPSGCISTAIVLSVAIGFAAMDRDRRLSEDRSQNNPTDAVLAVLAPQKAAQPKSRTARTWEQIIADRRQMGLNFLKGAALVVFCLIGIYYCLNIAWSAMRPKKQGDTCMGLHRVI